MSNLKVLRAVLVAVMLLVSPRVFAQLVDNEFRLLPEVFVGDWNVPGNWSRNHTPQPDERAIIPKDLTCNVTDDPQQNPHKPGAVQVYGTLVIASGGKLEVQNDLVVTKRNSDDEGVVTVNDDLVVKREFKVDDGAAVTIANSAPATVDHINIRNGGTMTVNTNGKLTLTDASNTRSRINGTLELKATLYIADSHTIRGDGGNIAMSGFGLIDGPSNKTLTIDGVGSTRATSLTIHGSGEIKAALMNKAYIVADRAGETLYLDENPKDSTTAGHWMAEGHETATLYAHTAEIRGGGWWELIDTSSTITRLGRIWVDPCCVNLSGEVINLNGELCVGSIFCTTGDLTIRSVGAPLSQPVVHTEKLSGYPDPVATFAAGSCGSCP